MKRRLLIVVVFLLAGAVVNVAVAWGCSFWPPIHQASVSEPQRIMIETAFREHFGLDENTREIHVLHSKGFGVTIWSADRSRPFGPWVTPTARRQHPDYEQLLLVEAGWPLRGINGSFGWSRSSPPTSQLSSASSLFRPIWPGFAVNTIFYAVVLWMLICGRFALRRLIRVKRGLCPSCGYDLRSGEHDACPECGRLPSAR